MAGRCNAGTDRDERTRHLRVLALFDVEDAAPLDAGRSRIGVTTRRRARLATDAAAKIGHHDPACHVAAPCFVLAAAEHTLAAAAVIFTRTMSAPEPVASVRSSDIVASEFMLGTPKFFVYGVAQ